MFSSRQFTFYVINGNKPGSDDPQNQGLPVFVTFLSSKNITVEYLRKQINAKDSDTVEIFRKDLNQFVPFQTEHDLAYVRNMSKFRLSSSDEVIETPKFPSFYMDPADSPSTKESEKIEEPAPSMSTLSTDSSSSYESNEDSSSAYLIRNNSNTSPLGFSSESAVETLKDPRKVRLERMLLKRAESMTNMSGQISPIRKRSASTRSLISILRENNIQVPKTYDSSTIKVFGSSLDAQMFMQKKIAPNIEYPLFLQSLAQALQATKAFEAEEIFKRLGNLTDIIRLKNELQANLWKTPNYKIEVTDPFTPGHLLRVWLSELPEALIPNSHYHKVMDAVYQPEKCVRLVNKRLPKVNSRVIQFLVKLFQQFLKPEVIAKTKMGANNISLLFAAFFLRNTKIDNQDPELIAETESQHQRFLKNLVNNMKFSDDQPELPVTPPPPPPPF